MPNEFVIKNGYISQNDSTINGSLSATTYYGDGSNLTGISGGGTFTGGTVNGQTIFTNGLSANTINLTSTPINNDSNTQLLSRNPSTGEIEYTTSSVVGPAASNTLFNYYNFI